MIPVFKSDRTSAPCCFSDRFLQMWDLDDPANFHEIVSRRDAPIKCARILAEPLVPDIEGCPLFGKRPALALASASESPTSKWPNSMVKLFSVPRNEFINQLRFKSRVLQVACNRRVFVVALQNHLYAFDATRMDKVLSLSTFPSPTKSHAVMALGSRWLAYASDEPLPRSAEPEPTALDRVVETASSAATDVAHSLLDFGKKTLNAYWWGESDAGDGAAIGAQAAEYASPTTPEQDARAGAVKVFDVVRLRSVAHFRAHWNAIAALEFDGSGTLLVTAAVDGQTFNVYSLRPPVAQPPAYASPTVQSSAAAAASASGGADGDMLIPRQLYRLVRGFTSAAIQSITFSGDSRYLSVASMRGTTHIYALSPTGGEVTLSSHAPAAAHAGGVADKGDRDAEWYRDKSPLVTLRALARIKSFTNVATTHGGEVLRVPAIASSSLFADAAAGLARGGRGPRCVYAAVRHGSDARQMFVVTQMGVVTRYQLQPHAPSAPAERAAAPNELNLDAVPVGAWDLCRRVRWDETKFRLRDELASHPASENPELAQSRAPSDAERASRWLASVEIETHTPSLRPLFLGPQCRVRTFTLAADVAQLREASIERALAVKAQQNADQLVQRHKSPMKKKKKNRNKAAAGGGGGGGGGDEEREGRPLLSAASARRVAVAQEVGILVQVDERTPSQLVSARRAPTNSGGANASSFDPSGDLEPARSVVAHGRLNDSVVRGDYEPLVDLPSPQPRSGASMAPSAPPFSGGAAAGRTAGASSSSASTAAVSNSSAPYRARLPGQAARNDDDNDDDVIIDQIAALVREAMGTPLRFASQLDPHSAVAAAPPAMALESIAPARAAVSAAAPAKPSGDGASPKKKSLANLMSSSSSEDDDVHGGAIQPIDLFDAASYEPRPPASSTPPSNSPRGKAAPGAPRTSPPKALPTPPGAVKLAAAPMKISSDAIEPPGMVSAASSSSAAAAPHSAPSTVSTKLKSYAQATIESLRRPGAAAAASSSAASTTTAAPAAQAAPAAAASTTQQQRKTAPQQRRTRGRGKPNSNDTTRSSESDDEE
jgi:hypothetical protein